MAGVFPNNGGCFQKQWRVFLHFLLSHKTGYKYLIYNHLPREEALISSFHGSVFIISCLDTDLREGSSHET